MAEDLDVFSGKPKKGFSIKNFLNKCLANWPVFVICMVLCIAAAFFYLRYAIPKYAASTLLMVKGASSSNDDLIETAVHGQLHSNFNFDNELVLLKSSTLLARVVANNELNISYYLIGKFQKKDIYLDAPFRLILQTITDSSSSLSINLKNLTEQGGNITFGNDKDVKKLSFRWNQTLKAGGKTFVFAKRQQIANNNQSYLVTWSPLSSTVGEISSKYTPSMLGKKASINRLEIIIENEKRGKAILNAIVREYNLADIEDRTVITRNTLRFIDDRLSLITNELSGVEGNLESYQGRNEIINLNTQSSQSFGNANVVSNNLQEINIKQGVVKMIQNYLNNPDTKDKLVPSTMGLDDATLSGLINRFNELQLTKQREAPTVTGSSTVMEDLNNQINDVRGSILEALQNINSNLKLQENSFQQQNSEYEQFLSSLPRKERAMQDIKRKQSITEGLYLYLLQKREESAISSTSASIFNYKQVEPATGGGQIEPNVLNVKLFAIILGMLLPMGFVYIKDVLNDKIISRDDFTNKVDLPVLGDINHLPIKYQTEDFVIKDRNVLGEQFRIIRTNLSLSIKKKEKQVILVTSSVSGEGKSFVSSNLAAVLAIPGKKVALLKFDMRKPSDNDTNSKGISGYLNGTTNNLRDMYTISKEIPSLHIYTSGAITSNPGDLMLNQNIPAFINTLKQQYDYIVIDSAPVGLVSDAFILGEYSDVVVYVIRQRVTEKKQFEYLNDIIASQKLHHITLVLNDVKTGKKYGYYGYGSKSVEYLEPSKN